MVRLDDRHLDALREVGNIGAAHAATSLAALLQRQVRITVPTVQLLSFDHVADAVGGAEDVVVGTYFRIGGDFPGNLFFILPAESARTVLHAMWGDGPFVEGADLQSDLALSALGEMGNILTSSYLVSLSEFTGGRVETSVPAVAVDMAQAILQVGMFTAEADSCLIIHTGAHIEELDIWCHFLLVPDPESVAPLLGALGVNGS
ncbi:MAG: chemotaxis protein CheC [Alicyclobacillaceae bacterium]|nr:chemotaxis protein CheC [Alicyclobacillaceae bacterium]